MERIDGPLALSFLSENFLGHEVVTFTLDGESRIHESTAQILLMNAVERQDYAAGKGGFVILGIAPQNPQVGEIGLTSFCIYHLDSYIPETIDVDAVIEEWDNQALDAWTTYNDEGGDE
ncbi:MAG: hypothetical protein CMC15_14175 [Flavobacteriaceae bacterium]|nr:hypothetical protein [Flavobacteriaceae bacterium]|tara:strand:- start:731 stop:1087 length:357 start_codon:yes stop_codon:yes gene_type:complete